MSSINKNDSVILFILVMVLLVVYFFIWIISSIPVESSSPAIEQINADTLQFKTPLEYTMKIHKKDTIYEYIIQSSTQK